MEVFVLALLYNIGKAGAHATRYRPWARQPLVRGLPISDVYHAFSGVQWFFVLPVCYWAWGNDGAWWALSLVAWGTVWPLSKLLKGLGWREALRECWYLQLLNYVRGKFLL
jgi:hypothetical protein